MKPYHVDDVLITPRQLSQRVDELAHEMAAGIHSDNLVVIGILRGSFIFLADLVRWCAMNDVHPRIDFMIMESYGSGTTPFQEPQVSRDCSIDVTDADVVVVDDILDTGRTLKKAVAHLKAKGARTVRTCVLLDKPARRIVPCQADYCGWSAPGWDVVAWQYTADGRVPGWGGVLDLNVFYGDHAKWASHCARRTVTPPPSSDLPARTSVYGVDACGCQVVSLPMVGASLSLLIAMMFFEPFMPTMCCVAPEMPHAM